jgi:hypothetical protein
MWAAIIGVPIRIVLKTAKVFIVDIGVSQEGRGWVYWQLTSPLP